MGRTSLTVEAAATAGSLVIHDGIGVVVRGVLNEVIGSRVVGL